MSKQQSFVCYGKVVAGGVQRVLFRTVVTPGNDPISKNAAVQNIATFVTYLEDLVEANTLFPGVTITAGARTAMTTAITDHIAAIQVGKRNRLKIGLSRVVGGVDAGKAAYTFTKVVNGVKSVQSITLVA